MRQLLRYFVAATFLALPGLLTAQSSTGGQGGQAGQAGQGGRAGQAGQTGQQGQAGQTGQAQGQAGARFSFQTPLYQQPNVGRALNLNRDQMTRLGALDTRLQNTYRDDFTRAFGSRERDRDATMQRLQGRFDSEWMRGARDIFNEEQMNRYRQLQLQYQGPQAFLDADVRTRLNLNEDQMNRLRDLGTRYQDQLRSFQNRDATGRDTAAERWNTLRRETSERINSILNEDQRRTWSQMTGERFDFGPPSSTPSSGGGDTTPRR